MLINKNSSEPVYLQVINQYKRQIATGMLLANTQLPSVRKLSYELGINPNTLQKAYTQLEAMGICYTVPGKGRFVAEDAKKNILADADQHYRVLDKAIEELAMCDEDIEKIIKRVKETYKIQASKMKGKDE